MCGIFGIIAKPESKISGKEIERILRKIAILSESRGKDSAGIAFRNPKIQTIDVIKGDIPIRELLNSIELGKQMDIAINAFSKENGFAAFGHARLVTNGTQLNEVNNQPVLKDNIVTIHNGIIVNEDKLWDEHPDLKREFSIDTEIIPSLIRSELNHTDNLVYALNQSFSKLIGTFSLAIMFHDLSQFVLCTNNGSLYYITDNDNFIIFASESYFLERLKKDNSFKSILSLEVNQIYPNSGLIIEYNSLKISKFNFPNNAESITIVKNKNVYGLNKFLLENQISKKEVVIDPSIYINRANETHLYNLLEYNTTAISKLKRCTKCLLPETFPFIRFDEKGECNYCKNYVLDKKQKSINELKEIIKPFKSKNGKPDCLVPFSGGRDSTYSLHIVKEELGLNPIAFTYDWGMVTDLARRNIARVCGKLGVENIIVSADIHWKRENIRKNVEAWLKNPSLGMIPLFMAGDKFFFYHLTQVKKKTGIDLNIWGFNRLENTDFKVGFAGLPPKFDKDTIYSLSYLNQLRLFGYVAKNVIKSPGYLNQSVIDSLGSFASRYVAPRIDYYQIFDYYKWDENEINDLILNDYNWETAIDTKSTWRIGDGTASFYNYIYYTVAGFSENDTFRSNQIREGMLDRETALKLCEEDNRPRYETLRWYLEIIGLDFAEVVKIINKIPKLYKL
jgi:glucosamine--fructose-6-phosphate aminotransferase (isomerizing)